MRIAQIAPLYEPVPPPLYGGTERVVAHLADALVELGHDVTVFACAGTATRARLAPARDQALRLDPTPLKSDVAAHLTMLDEVRRRAAEFDVLHFHLDLLHFPFFESVAERTLTTLHGRLDIKDLPGLYQRWPQYPLVSISDNQRRPLAFANWVATIHHGIPADQYPFSANRGSGLLFVGRVSPEKRPDRAIEIAKRAGMDLTHRGEGRRRRSRLPPDGRRAPADATRRDFRRRGRRPDQASPDELPPPPCSSRSTGPSRSAWS